MSPIGAAGTPPSGSEPWSYRSRSGRAGRKIRRAGSPDPAAPEPVPVSCAPLSRSRTPRPGRRESRPRWRSRNRLTSTASESSIRRRFLHKLRPDELAPVRGLLDNSLLEGKIRCILEIPGHLIDRHLRPVFDPRHIKLHIRFGDAEGLGGGLSSIVLVADAVIRCCYQGLRCRDGTVVIVNQAFRV